jgi:phosphatidylglycerol:prolipoprotein diacylglycerol transferase
MLIDQYGIHLGPFYFRFYAMALMSGILAAAFLIAYRAKRWGHDPELVWDGLAWVVLAGILGARLYHVLTPPPSMGITFLDYLQRPLDIIAIWKGGLGIPGALVGGGLAAYFYTRSKGLDWLEWADLIIPGVALGQAIGRLGNYFNQELYGKPTDLPWAVTIRPDNRVPGYQNFDTFHPMFLYEMILNLAIVVALIWIHRRFTDWLLHGDLLALYMIFYPTGRFFLEFLKLDAPALGQGLTVAQILSVLSIIIGLTFIVVRHRLVTRQSSADPAH